MLTLNISKTDIELANYERIHNPVLKIRKRMEAIYWTSQGLSRQEVCGLSGVHRNSICNFIKIYNSEGFEGLKRFHYKGFISLIETHRLSIEELFSKRHPRTTREAVSMIAALTGQNLSLEEVRRFMHKIGMRCRKSGHIPSKADPIKQSKFLDDQLNPLIEKAKNGECHLFFMDAAHFVLGAFIGMVWSFKRVFIKGSSGRHRINVLGALHVISRQIETVINTDYVNAYTIEEMLKLLACKYTDLPIYIVLDNARYQRCKYIDQIAATLKIELVFLPSYSPNLNLIERVWRFIKKDILSLEFFDCKEAFHQKIKTAIYQINNDANFKKRIYSLTNPKFQLFAQNLLG